MLAKMQLGLDHEHPAARTAYSHLEWPAQDHAKGYRYHGMPGRRPGMGDELAA